VEDGLMSLGGFCVF